MRLINHLIILLSLFILPIKGDIQPLNLTIPEIILPTVEQWNELHNDHAEVTAALQAFHDTSPFTQSLEDFRNNPNHYIQTRIQALENLIATIDSTKPTQDLELLKTNSQNKIRYLKALPDMLNIHCTKLDALPYQSKPIKMKDSYALESLDPLHRWGHDVMLRMDRWLASEIPNYFIFLETIEHDALLNKYAPTTHQVVYFHTQEEREQHRLIYKEGLWYLDEKPFDSSNFFTFHSGDGYAIFMLGLDREIYVNKHISHKLHHSSEFAGKEILSGGEIVASDGKILRISNKSGHYAPAPKDLLEMLAVLKERLGNLEEIEVDLILRKPNYTGTVQAAYNAEEMLASGEHTVPLSAKKGWTPLHVVVWENKLKYADRVLNPKNLNAMNDDGNTPLHIAAQEGYSEWVKYLLEHGANPGITNKAGNTPLHLAARTGNAESVKLLFVTSDPAKTNLAGETALLLAVRSGNIETYNFLAGKGVSQDVADNENNHILFYAVSSKTPEMLQTLLNSKHREKLHVRNNKGASLLHFAAAFATPEIIEILMQEGFDINAIDSKGNTLLHYAAGNGNGINTDFILDKEEISETFWSQNADGALPFHLGAGYLPLQQLKRFIEIAQTTELYDNQGKTPVFYAADSSIPQGSKNIHLLALNGADLTVVDQQGNFSIHTTSQKQDYTISMALLSHADLIESIDGEGNTPLHKALEAKAIKTATYLIPHTNKEAILRTNAKGKSALDLAEELGNKSILDMLKEKLAND